MDPRVEGCPDPRDGFRAQVFQRPAYLLPDRLHPAQEPDVTGPGSQRTLQVIQDLQQGAQHVAPAGAPGGPGLPLDPPAIVLEVRQCSEPPLAFFGDRLLQLRHSPLQGGGVCVGRLTVRGCLRH